MTYYGHTGGAEGGWEPLRDHLYAVAARAGQYAAAFDACQQGQIAGLLHDLGKYGDLFQARLRGEARGIDHASAGAVEALRRYQRAAVAAAVAIQGHHGGLQVADRSALQALSPAHLAEPSPENLTRSGADLELLMERFCADGLQLPAAIDEAFCDVLAEPPGAAMLDVRMLYSALVDADFIETEAHFRAVGRDQGPPRPEPLELEPARDLDILQAYLHELAAASRAAENVQGMRADLLTCCLQAGQKPPGLYTLTAPTGAGKTLAMLAFALRHAAEHGLRRIVMVIPYLTIIEQTVQVYREALGQGRDSGTLERYILEHHSLAGSRDDDGKSAHDGDDTGARALRMLTENWDAPIIVTTSVQFLESLHAARPGACRKLHRLARSVILFDEVQTLPGPLAVPTLATLSRLADRYGSSVVFSTATQPAFAHLHDTVGKFCASGWRPQEIVPTDLELFQRARRTTVRWPDSHHQPLGWPELAQRLAESRQVLCIVNLKRHAWALLDALSAEDDVFHLSTSMCPAHRQEVLDEVRRRLDSALPCRLISTQCVEAGVDVDFPLVWRAWGPLEAIAQAAGRCNRNGHAQLADVVVFRPLTEDDRRPYPDEAYQQAAQVAQTLLAELGTDGFDISDPETFTRYYRRLYSLQDPDRYEPLRSRDPLIGGIYECNFPRVAEHYRLIEQNSVNLLVPYCLQSWEKLAHEARNRGITRNWVQLARPHTVSIFRPRAGDPVHSYLEPVSVAGRQEYAHDWYIYTDPDSYDPRLGLTPPQSDRILMI